MQTIISAGQITAVIWTKRRVERTKNTTKQGQRDECRTPLARDESLRSSEQNDSRVLKGLETDHLINKVNVTSEWGTPAVEEHDAPLITVNHGNE